MFRLWILEMQLYLNWVVTSVQTYSGYVEMFDIFVVLSDLNRVQFIQII